MLESWLKDGRQYQLEMAGEGADNPDQRIAEDIRVSVDLAVDFVGGVGEPPPLQCSSSLAG